MASELPHSASQVKGLASILRTGKSTSIAGRSLSRGSVDIIRSPQFKIKPQHPVNDSTFEGIGSKNSSGERSVDPPTKVNLEKMASAATMKQEMTQMGVLFNFSKALQESALNKKPKDLIKVYEIKVRRENKRREMDDVEMYFGDESEDLMYQYKYMKMFDYDLLSIKLKIIATKANMSIRVEVQDPKFRKMMKAVLQEVDQYDAFGKIAGLPLHFTPSKVEPRKSFFQQLQDIKLNPSVHKKFAELNFCPYFENFNQTDCDKLSEWLEDKKDKFISYNYAKSYLTKDTNLTIKRQEMNEFLQAGIIEKDQDCVCSYLTLKFQRMRKHRGNEERNEHRYKEAYILISETFIVSGIISNLQQKDINFVFLKFFYILLDCFPGFRKFCFGRIRQALEYMGPDGAGRNVFRAEHELSADPEGQLIRDITMILLLEFDITSDDFVYSLNLIEHLCLSSEKFSYLGLFLGDFYDSKLAGSIQQADEDKRIIFYEKAEKSKSYEGKVQLQARARLSLVYQSRFDQILDNETKRIEKDTTGKLSKNMNTVDNELKMFYNNMLKLNEELLKLHHPIALNFFVHHYIRCNDAKVRELLWSDGSDLPAIILERNDSLYSAVEYLAILDSLGDNSQLDLYFRLLKHLKFQETIFAAIKRIGDGSDENLYIPLAYCKEKGIGGSPDIDFSLTVYRKVIDSYLERRDLYKIGMVLYRIGMIMRRGDLREEAESLIKESLLYHLTWKQQPDKRFLFHVAMALTKINIDDRDSMVKILLLEAYRMYPNNTAEYLVHYEIERKIEKNFNFYKSRLNKDINELSKEIFVSKSFVQESLSRRSSEIITAKASSILQELKSKLIKTVRSRKFYQSPEENLNTMFLKLDTKIAADKPDDMLDYIEYLDKTNQFIPYVNSAQLRMSSKITSNPQNSEADEKFKKIKHDKESLMQLMRIEKSVDQQIEVTINKIMLPNAHVRVMSTELGKGIEVEHCDNINELADASQTFMLVGYPCYKMRVKTTNQLCRMIKVNYINLRLANLLLENFSFFFTYNPFFLNYLGVDYNPQAANNSYEVCLFSEYFESTCASNKNGFLRARDMPFDRVHLVAYHIIHAVRSLHSIGKVNHFIHPDFIVLTPTHTAHLVLPFWEKYFLDIDSYINQRGQTVRGVHHFAPEILTCRDGDSTQQSKSTQFSAQKSNYQSSGSFAPKGLKVDNVDPLKGILHNISENLDFGDQQENITSGLKYRSRYFDVLDAKFDKKLFNYCAAADMWSLGVLLYQLYTSEPFYDEEYFLSVKSLVNFMEQQDEVRKFIKSKLDRLPRDLPDPLRLGIKACLKFNPMARPTIHGLLINFEQVVYREIYGIQPVTMASLAKQMFDNAYFDREREVRVVNTSEHRVILLPKAYTFEGSCFNNLPEGQGIIKLKDSVVLSGVFKEGVLDSNVEIRIGTKDFIKVTKELRNGFPTEAELVYHNNMADKKIIKLNKFEKNSWMLDNEGIIQDFQIADESLALEDKRKADDKNRKEEKESVPIEPWMNSNSAYLLSKYDLKKQLAPKIDTALKEIKLKNVKEKKEILSILQTEILEKIEYERQEEPEPELLKKKKARDIKVELIKYLSFLKKNMEMFDNTKLYSEDKRLDPEDVEEEEDIAQFEIAADISPIGNLIQNARKSQMKEKHEIEHQKMMSAFLSSVGNSIENTRQKEQKMAGEAKVQLEEYLSTVLDPFGRYVKMMYSKKDRDFLPAKGLAIINFEPGNIYKTVIFKPDISSSQMILSQVNSISICDFTKNITNFGELDIVVKRSYFPYAIIALMDHSRMIYRGLVNKDGPVNGKLYLDGSNNKFIKFEAGSGTSFKGLMVDIESQIEYDGGLVNLKKNGFGKLKIKGIPVFIGYFRDDLPHGKGLLINPKTGALTFKGIFCHGKKRFGTTFSKDRKEISGIYHWIGKESSDGKQPPSVAMFLNTNNENDALNYFVEGSIGEKRKLPVYYTSFSGWNMNFSGPVRIDFGQGAYFFGMYRDKVKKGRGILVDTEGNTLDGVWEDKVCRGVMTYNKSSSCRETMRTGTFTADGPENLVQFGIGMIVYKDQSKYRGEIQNSLPQGFGRLLYFNGDCYSGEFKAGEYEGIGILEVHSKKYSLEGKFKENKLNGYGVFANSEDRMIGRWENNTMLWMFSKTIPRKLNGLIIDVVLSQVEYNHFENTYTKKGLCEMTFLKVVNQNCTTSRIASTILSSVIQAFVMSKPRHDNSFKMAYHIVRTFVEDLVPTYFKSREGYGKNPLKYKDLVLKGVERICDEQCSFKPSEDKKRREMIGQFLRKFNERKPLIDTILKYSLMRIAEVLLHDKNKQFIDIIKNSLMNGTFDDRQVASKNKLTENLTMEFYTVLKSTLFELNRNTEKAQLEITSKAFKSSKRTPTVSRDLKKKATVVSNQELLPSIYQSSRNIEDLDKSVHSGSQGRTPAHSPAHMLHANMPLSPLPLEQMLTPDMRQPHGKHGAKRRSIKVMPIEQLLSSDRDDLHNSRQLNQNSTMMLQNSTFMHQNSTLYHQNSMLYHQESIMFDDPRQNSVAISARDENEDHEWLSERTDIWQSVIALIDRTAEDFNRSIPDTYSGEIFNDEINGFGAVYHEGKMIYMGEVKDNIITGFGKINFSEEKNYKGQVDWLKPHGLGVMTVGQESYEGEFERGKRNGIVIKKFRTKIVAVGSYSNDERNGAFISKNGKECEMIQVFEDGVTKITEMVDNNTFPAFYKVKSGLE